MSELTLSDIYFDVQKIKSKDLFGQSFATGIDYAIHAPSKGKVLNMCSEQYELVSNECLFQPIYQMLCGRFGKDMIQTNITNIDDRKFYVNMVVNNKPYQVQYGDIVCPTVCLHNSYDGKLKFGVGVGFHRVICSNGMMAFQSEKAVNLKHRSGMVDFDILFEMLDKVDDQLARFRKLSNRKLTPKEYEELGELIKEKTDFPKNLIKEVPEVIVREQVQLNSHLTKWLVYHGYNNRLNHAEIKMHPEFKQRIDAQVLHLVEAFN